ncbi:MAG TPA: NAD-glutamate dehydrogenase domain-containing protein, partial [Phenylobacterium sp.]|nr:NAD-glutamate dehydrogenase domain-containing protein [Phenylobacterium sp.]
LVLELGISWRWAALVRALARYRQQSGLDPSQAVQEQALADHSEIARLILDLFRIRFDPAIKASMAARDEQAAAVMGKITEALQEVASLDDDRVLRRLAALVQAIQRTNFYQAGEDGAPKPYISFKVASQQLADLPAPKPFREIFVSANHVEGVHLRFGPVARGGLRWSDRRDDFRTEVLALAKAQNTKNAVIVPLGSKGGFYPKQLPKGGAPDAVRAEGVRAYTTFLNGLLDLTDNIGADGGVIPPPDLVRHDGDDPYLVVAADKGTATFSDIANGIAESRGFWLGDAFASGGSAGYDHKAMGITARGAWEAVKRHFRELGKDIQAEPFTVIGVGDMSGDVFGNGMLLSDKLRLVAAYDHRHVFIDPSPDAAVGFEERKRMFELPRSSWDDYDRKLISRGGGVFPRSQKSIPLSPEVRAWLGVTAEALPPGELIHAILQAEAELLYLGGIGTYVKARDESHADVGDKANDIVRVNAGQLKVRVVGEGANLGLTQAARIEFALAGGRINTDAIDNSAGVDSSDHEVNIKILTGMLEREGKLTRRKRDPLLASMTDAVAENVLAHNYDQTLALSLMQMDAPGELEAYARYMLELESDGRLERAVEGLPDPLAIAERAKAGLGLVRPELAVVMAYAKNDTFAQVIAGAAPDDPAFEAVLEGYFPKPLRKYDDQMRRHRLRREIITTVLVNDLINRAGATFPSRLYATTGCNRSALIVAFAAAKQILAFDPLWEAVEDLDGKAPAAGQMALFRAMAHSLRGMIYWFAKRASQEHLTVGGLTARYGKGVDQLRKLVPGVLSPVEQAGLQGRLARLVEAGAPEDLALRVAALQPLTTASNLVDLAEGSSWGLPEVARLYHQAGAAFGFDRLRAAAGEFRSGDSFERSAVRRLIEDLLAEQTTLTRAIMAFSGAAHAGATAEDAAAAVASWRALRREPADLAAQT